MMHEETRNICFFKKGRACVARPFSLSVVTPKVPGTFLWSESVRHKYRVVVREVPGTLPFHLNRDYR